MTVSVITAFLNEAENLDPLRNRLCATLQSIEDEWEVILVDDHSTDESLAIAKRWAEDDPRVMCLSLSRNCGAHAAVTAGLEHCTGECAVIMPADLQAPPEVIPDLLAKWREGHDVVWALRAGREGGAFGTRLLSWAYYHIMRRIALPEMPTAGADLLLMDRKVIDAYTATCEKNTSFSALVLWMGFRQTAIEYVKEARHSGRSKWTLAKKLKLFVDSMVSFSYVPIRLMSCMGLLFALLGFAYAAVVVVGRLVGWVTPGTGFAALMTVLLVGQGMMMTMLGVLGEYLWRTYDEARHRPWYIIQERFSRSLNESSPPSSLMPAHKTTKSPPLTSHPVGEAVDAASDGRPVEAGQRPSRGRPTITDS